MLVKPLYLPPPPSQAHITVRNHNNEYEQGNFLLHPSQIKGKDKKNKGKAP